MDKVDYQALIDEAKKEGRDDAALRRRAERLAEAARNLETLQALAEEEAKKNESEE